VQGLHNAASTIALPRFHYTGRNAHTEDQTIKKGVVVDSLVLVYGHIFKNGQQKNFSVKQPLKTANPKIVRPINLKYGQISKIWTQNG